MTILNLRKKLLINSEKWEEVTKEYERTFLLFITDKCNLNCSYCFNKPNLHTNDFMTMEYIMKIIFSNPKIIKIDLMGGEPLLHPDINKVISFLESEQKQIGLYTNGYFLDKLSKKIKLNLKINISFQSIYSNDKSLKPLSDIKDKINEYSELYPFKLVFLLNPQNKDTLYEVVKYIEIHLKNISKLTIGSVRNEADYINDNYPFVLPFNEYYTIVQNFINQYNGKLDIDIFTKGILFTDKLPFGERFQLNRFKSIFPKNKYVPCLYLIANNEKQDFDFNNEIKYYECESCHRTGLKNCMADKIYLKRKHEQQ